jgi:ribosome-associated protein
MRGKNHEAEPHDGDGAEKPSKSARKREIEAMQQLADRMTGLSDRELERLGVGAPLRAALSEARAMKASSARNRHIKYCVRLMDPQELDQVQAYLADRQSQQVASNRLLHAAERWRDRLVEEGDAGLDALLEEHADLDRHALRQLQRDAARERATGRPAGAGRKLFRALRDALTRASEQKIQ